ncbi:putative aminopeptidase W07G4.4 [Diorhabda sublineata]|uniref:putative aminopeptidase W07G4.4 n=1 Tax=Diorhabda sublineata TaxID=1163346 RepID=UPI0024E051C2|nr:putative aminopeptidase W07G4.4 [Diorhabda sublineata]
MSPIGPPETKVIVETSLESPEYDGILIVSAPGQVLKCTKLKQIVEEALKFDPSLKSEIAVLQTDLPAKRLVYSPTGPIDSDYDDVRIFKNSAAAGVKRALKAGIKKLLLVLEEFPAFENAELVTLLGALEALYTPIQVREHDPSKQQKVDYLGVYTHNSDKTKGLISLAVVLETGRRVACDIGDSDPERMTPARTEEYVKNLFKDSNIKLTVVSDIKEIKKGYPLFEAVNRAASVQERHNGRIIYLEYNPPQAVKETLFIVGKGVTMDTGGVDVKIGGAMVGMSRDKCGAAAAAGFMAVVNLLQPQNLKVIVGLGMVRNSIGSNGYTTDEVLTARSGARVRVVNTDAEGRMIMTDILCKFKEDAITAVNPQLYTIATLTGHAHRSVGEGYSIAMDNGPARKLNIAGKLQQAGDKVGDLFEISRLRRDDFKHHKGEMEGDDLIQSAAKPSTLVTRGHQGPGAFLIVASGLDKHGSDSEVPLKYTHIDIAGSAGSLPLPATGAPVLALSQAYLF